MLRDWKPSVRIQQTQLAIGNNSSIFLLARSPVFSHLSTSLIGLTTVRARRCESIFECIFDQCQDAHSSAWFVFLATSRWFGVWLDWICVLYVACITFTCVALFDSKRWAVSSWCSACVYIVICPGVNSSEVGLVIASALALTGQFQWGVRQSAEAENQMTSVERVIEYGQLPSEAPLECTSKGMISNQATFFWFTGKNTFLKDKEPHLSWPAEGFIQFDGMSLQYSETDRPVLRDITCLIKGKEKVANH